MSDSIDQYYAGLSNTLAPDQTKINTASAKYSNDLVGGSDLTQKLTDALNNKVNNNEDLNDQMAGTMSNYFQAPSTARVKYANIWDPAQREKLVAGDVAQALQPYDVFSNILKTRQGNLADLVKNGVAGWTAQTSADQNDVTNAQNNYNNKVGLMGQATSMYNATEPPASTIKSPMEQLIEKKIMDTINGSGSGGKMQMPTETQPAYSPALTPAQRKNIESGKGAYISPGGQWYWDYTTDNWLPIVE
jgi:hypothetical protein